MSAFSGSALHVDWIQAAATTTLTGDHKNFSYTPSIGLIDSTAGADAQKGYIVGVKDGNMTFNAVFQGSTSTGGTTTSETLTEGNEGTLKWSPEGTAATKPYFQAGAISQGVAFNHPYDNVTEMTVAFQQNGARTAGTN